ncbi:unnamed protein product, partial [Meganyctiphanes norvegica]
VDYTKKQCKKVMQECDEEIVKTEKAIKVLQENIERKKNSRMQMDEHYAIFCEKIGKLRNKRHFYDQAVTSLKTSETLKGVSQCSVEVRNETEKLQKIAYEIENELKLMMKAFQDSGNCSNNDGNDSSEETDSDDGDSDDNEDNNNNMLQ